MELKVWVNGRQRMLCGVTDNTTCQDIIIALAHAMACTGRFLLIEQWREFKRTLSPKDYPARILQNWGEYVSEVKLGLQFLESKLKIKNDFRNHNIRFGSRVDQMTLKRSSTFAGNRSNIHAKLTTVKTDNIHVDSKSNSAVKSCQNLLPSSSTKQETMKSQSLPTHSNVNCHITFCYCKTGTIDVDQIEGEDLEVIDYESESINTFQHLSHNGKENSNPTQSANLDIEEYDLDRNYPDILCDFKGKDHPKHRMDQRLAFLKNERSHLIKLIASQLDRIKTKEFQIDGIDTEISSLEVKKKNHEHLGDMREVSSKVEEEEDKHSSVASIESQLEEWKEELCIAQKYGVDLKASISDFRNKHEHILESLQCMELKEVDLLKNIKEMEQEKELAAEFLSQLNLDVSHFKKDLMLKHCKCKEIEEQLNDLNEDIYKLENLLKERSAKIDDLKEELEKQNESLTF